MKHAAERLRALPARVHSILQGADDACLRARPAEGEWSAIEVAGHLVDKMQFWSERVERITREDEPLLPGYDQDAYVRQRRYQEASLHTVMDNLRTGCARFAALVDGLPETALTREGIHQEMGPISLAQCVSIPVDSADEHLVQMQAALAATPTTDAVPTD